MHLWFSSVTQLCWITCDTMDSSKPAFLLHHQLQGLAQTSCPSSQWMPSNCLILCHPLLLLPSILPSRGDSVLCIRWPKDWSFSFINPSNEYSGLISFRIDWFDLLTVQGTLKSLLYTTVQKHQFFGAQLSLRSNSHIHT